MNTYAIAALAFVHLLGFNCMYGLIYRNGYIDALIRLRDYGPHVLPGSNNPILTRFVGIGPLDKLMTLGGVLFANVTDGSAPELSLYGFYFAGQLVGIFAIIILESLRLGNHRSVISVYSLWGCAMNAFGYGFVMPLYAITHLLTSDTVSPYGPPMICAFQIEDSTSLTTLPTSFVIGYYIPIVLMAVPCSSNMLHQWLSGLWQGFPLWIALFQLILGRVSRNRKEQQINPQTIIRNLRVVYSFAFISASVSHMTTFVLIVVARFLPFLLSPSLAEAFTFRNVFVPPSFQNPGLMKSMATGIHNFFQYDQYVGSIAAILWILTLKLNTDMRRITAREAKRLIFELVGAGLLAGPAGVMLALMWDRENSLLLNNGAARGGY